MANLLDEAAGEQRSHHAVDIDPSDGRYAGPRDWLGIGDNGKRFQGSLGQLRGLALQHVAGDQVCVLVTGVVPPAAADLPELETATGLVIEGGQLREGLGNDRFGHLDGLCQLELGHRLGSEQ
jgi:hypothetical protein